MKGIPLAFLGLACVGCATTYRSAQGPEFHEEDRTGEPSL